MAAVGPDPTRSLLVRGVRRVPLRDAAPAAAGVVQAPVDIRVTDGVVTQVGVALSDRGEEVLGGAGRWVVPGLWDHHVHAVQVAAASLRLDLGGTRTPQEALDRIAAHVAALRDPEQVVITWGHRSALWPRPVTVAELDTVSGAHPVVAISGDGHNGWLNSRALQMLGVPPRDGRLDEDEWFAVFARLGQRFDLTAAAERALPDAVAAAHRLGVVGIVDLEFDAAFREWPRRVATGLDTLRVRAGVYPDQLEEVLEAGWTTGADLGAGLIRMGPLKIISDGSLNTRTAYCCTPFCDTADRDFPRGKINYSTQAVTELSTRAHGAGLDVAVHAIGDAAVAQALDAFESTGARGTIEHAQLISWDDIPRMAELGVAASVQPAHLLDDRDVSDVCWADRTERSFAMRTMLEAGVELRLGSDAPVSPLDPWLAMAAAVHRSGDERDAWHPEQSLSAAQALAASTDGTLAIEAGSLADLVLLDADPLRHDSGPAAAAHLRAMPVATTIVDGRVVYDAR